MLSYLYSIIVHPGEKVADCYKEPILFLGGVGQH